MAETLYVVTGATGHVGGALADGLLAARRRVRVVGRDAARLKRFTDRGAEAAVGSLDDAAFVAAALRGAGAVFAMIPPQPGAPSFRAFQGRVVAAFSEAARAARPRHVLVLSSIGADVGAGNGPIAGLHELEERLAAVPGVATLGLRPGYFLENHLAGLGLVKGMGIYGSALAADLKMAQIATRDIGAVAARRMGALDWTGREVHELHGQRDLTMAEVTAVLGRAIGRPELRYVAFPYADAEKGMIAAGLSPDLAGLYVEMSRGFNEGTIRATQPRTAATTTPTTVEWFAENVFAPAFRG
jgi:uncharacterized protein YbjT (DUF2867 family)